MGILKKALWLIIAAAVVGIDQLTKQLAVTYLKPIDTKPLIEGVLHLTYLENRGAAFGMLADHRWVFMITSTAAVIGITIFMYAAWDKFYHPLLYTGLAFIVGGGIGNMIDRVLAGYVVDFIDFRLINFAIFNGADSFVCVGAALVVIWVLVIEGKKENQ
ncbi:MAG: signal peptidase II [Clostridia bacterium]|nr:signal peptidase II [Clostridia bacterium]